MKQGHSIPQIIWTGLASDYDLPELLGHAAIDGEVDAAVEDEQDLKKIIR